MGIYVTQDAFSYNFLIVKMKNIFVSFRLRLFSKILYIENRIQKISIALKRLQNAV